MKASINEKYTAVVSTALLATVLAFMGIVHVAVVGYYEQKVRMGDSQLTHILATHIERNIRAEDEVIGMLADYPDIMERPVEQQQFILLKTARNHPHYELLSTVDMNGDQIARSWGEGGPRGDRAWFLDFKRTHHGAISDVYVSRSTGNDIVTITKGIFDASRNPVGLIMADIRTTDLKNLIQSANSDPDCEVYLLDNGQNIIAAPDGRDADDVGDVLAGAQDGGLFTMDDGRRLIGVYQTIDIPEINVHWSLMLVRDYDAALAPVTSILQRTLVLGIIIALIAIAVLYSMNRRVTHGFLRAGQVLRLAGGDIEAHVSASIGIARYPTDARTVDDLVQLADAAMYVAKQNGRGRYVVTNGKKTEEA